MAGIIYNTGNAATLNPTARHLPVRVGNQFLDSSFYQDGDYQTATILHTVENTGVPFGFKLDPANQVVYMGDFIAAFNNSFISVDDVSQAINIFAPLGIGIASSDPSAVISLNAANIISNTNFIRLNGTLTQSTSGSTSGLHLRINVNGTNYVIELKNP